MNSLIEKQKAIDDLDIQEKQLLKRVSVIKKRNPSNRLKTKQNRSIEMMSCYLLLCYVYTQKYIIQSQPIAPELSLWAELMQNKPIYPLSHLKFAVEYLNGIVKKKKLKLQVSKDWVPSLPHSVQMRLIDSDFDPGKITDETHKKSKINILKYLKILRDVRKNIRNEQNTKIPKLPEIEFLHPKVCARLGMIASEHNTGESMMLGIPFYEMEVKIKNETVFLAQIDPTGMDLRKKDMWFVFCNRGAFYVSNVVLMAMDEDDLKNMVMDFILNF